MITIRIKRLIESDTLHLPEIKPFIGRTVDIIIQDESAVRERFLALAPQEEPLDAEEIAALRADPRYRRFWSLLEVVGQDIIDDQAIAELRAASVI